MSHNFLINDHDVDHLLYLPRLLRLRKSSCSRSIGKYIEVINRVYIPVAKYITDILNSTPVTSPDIIRSLIVLNYITLPL